MKLRILGTSSAFPTRTRNHTANLLNYSGESLLFDCGEGTQLGLRKNKIKFSRIKCIFISHLHGDHYFGLIGLISTFSLLNRTSDLHIYGPLGLKDLIINQIKASGLDIPSKSETQKIGKDFQVIVDELEKQKGDISKLKQKINKLQAEL